MRTEVLLAARVGVRRTGRDLRLDVCLAIGLVLIVAVVLLSWSGLRVADAQQGRARDLTPSVAHDREPAPGELSVVDPLGADTRRWDGHTVHRTYYALGRDGLNVPGVVRMPRSGEYVSSPALDELVASDETIAALFTGLRRVGQIEDEGLTDPADLRAVIGVAPTTALLVPVEGFGPTSRPDVGEDRGGVDRVVALIGLSVTLLPGAALLVIVTRLHGRAAQGRARALRVLGVSRLGTRLVEAVGTVMVAVPACATGVLVHTWLLQLERVPGTDFGFFAEDAQLPSAGVALVAILGVSVAAGLAASAARLGGTGAPARAESAGSRRSFVAGTAMMALGLVVLLSIGVWRWLLGDVANLLFWGSCALTAIGLAAAGPRLTAVLAARAAPRARAAGTQIGLRMAAATGSTVVRVAAMLCLVLVLTLASRSFLSILGGGSQSDWRARVASETGVPTVATDLGGEVSLALVRRAVPAIPVAQAVNVPADRGTVPAVAASCADLARLSGAPLEGCGSGLSWLDLGSGEEARPSGSAMLGGRSVNLDGVQAVTRASNLPSELDGALLVGAESLPRTGDGSVFYLLPPGNSLTRDLARLSSLSPLLELDLGPSDRHNPDVQQFPVQVEVVGTTTVLGVAIGVLALVAGAVGEARTRASRYRGLHLVGAPRQEVLRAHGWSTTWPVLVLGVAGCVVGWTVCRALVLVDERAVLPSSALLLAVVGVVSAAVLVAVVTWRDAARTPTP